MKFKSSLRPEQREMMRLQDRVPKEYRTHFSPGGWFCRLRREDPETIKAPRFKSRRPNDIDTRVWSEAGSGQEKELATMKAEADGQGPPDLPKWVEDRLTMDELRGVSMLRPDIPSSC